MEAAVRLRYFERGRGQLAPLGKEFVHALDEMGKLGMFVDGGLDGLLIHGKIEVTGALARCPTCQDR